MGIIQGLCLLSLLVNTVSVNTQLEDNVIHPSTSNRNHMVNKLSAMVTSQVSLQMEASLMYTMFASYFGSEEVNRPGFRKLFYEASKEGSEHALKFVAYLNKRGEKLSNLDIKIPNISHLNSTVDALKYAIYIENQLTDYLMQIHGNSTILNDPNLSDFLEDEFLGEQIESLRRLQGLYNNLESMFNPKDRAQNKLAEYLFDIQLQKQS